MNIVTTILLGGAAYLYLSGRKEQERLNDVINDLNKKNDELAADVVIANAKNDDLKDEFLGSFRDRMQAKLTVYISRVGWAGDYWNSTFDLRLTNVSKQAITLSAIRVFWSCMGRKSSMVPWTDASYTIQPGKTITIKLYAFNNKNHFLSIPDIQYIENLLKESGKDPNNKDLYKKHLPVVCEMEALQSVNGKNFLQVLKNFNGELIGYTDGRVWHPYKWENGTDDKIAKAFNEAEKDKDEQE